MNCILTCRGLYDDVKHSPLKNIPSRGMQIYPTTGQYLFNSICWFVVFCPSKSILTCDSVHSWWLYNAVPLGDLAMSTMTWYPPQSHYPDTESTSSCHSLIMLSEHLATKQQVSIFKWLIWLNEGSTMRSESPDSQNRRETLYSFSHLIWFII